jgi:membrane protease YdiL (CAAX protease family)
MGNIFYNREEGRLRAGWRLVLQLAVMFGIAFLLQIILGIAVGMLALASGINLQDAQALQDFALNNPLLRASSTLAVLIGALVSYWVAGRWLDRRPFKAFGFHFNGRWWLDLFFGLVLGAVLMALIFMVELASGWIEIAGTMQAGSGSFATGILSALIVFLAVGIYEEMLSRGYWLLNISETLRGLLKSSVRAILVAYLLSSTVFGLLHATNPNATVISTVNLMVAGLFLGLGYILTGELAIPIGLHITWNFFQGNVFGFPVSGGQAGTTFIAIEQGGPDLLTGGAFGPEAGLIGIAAILLGSLLTLLWVKLTRGSVRLQTDLAEYPHKLAPHTETQVQEPPLS